MKGKFAELLHYSMASLNCTYEIYKGKKGVKATMNKHNIVLCGALL